MPRTPYVIDGKEVPSVTEILDVIAVPGLLEWYGKCGLEKAKQISSAASQFGSAVHGLLEMVFHGFEPEDVPENVLVCAEKLQQKLKTMGLKQVSSEVKVYSREHLYAGTFDGMVAEDKKNGLHYVLDWKTSSSVRLTYPLQLAAYAHAAQETDPKTAVAGGVIIRAKPRDVEAEAVVFTNLPHYFKLFLAAKSLYDHVSAWGNKQ